MKKKYVAKTDLHISVMLKSKQSVHISFHSQTGGGSVFYTDNAEIQEALEKHPKFGKLFKEVALPKVEPAKKAVKTEAEPPAENNVNKVEVTDLDDAKDYLSERFGVSRTKLRSKANIMAEAEKHKIEFVGI